MINSIELVNWRSHKHTVLNFQKGVNVLIGIMGSGKSSVMDAISFGLFGTFPALTHRRTSLDDLILNKPRQENEAEIKIKFTIGNDTYTATRNITRNLGTTARLEKNDSYLQAQPERVSEEIEHVLNVDYDTFSRVVYSEQNRLDYFLELAKGDRKRQIDQMLGLDRFANAESNVTSLINSIKSLINDEEQVLSQIDVGEFKKQLEALAKEKENTENEQESLSNESAVVKAGVEKSGKELAELKLRYEKRSRLVKEIAELESRVSTLKKEIEKIIVPYGEDKLERESSDKREKEKLLSAELRNLKDKRDAAMRMLAYAESELKGCEAKVKERDRILGEIKGKDLEKLEKNLKENDKALQELMKNLAALRGKREELIEWVNELSKHISKCPICERALDEELRNRLLNEKTALAKRTDKEIEKASKETEEMSNMLARIANEHNTVLLASKKLEDYKSIEELRDRARENAESEKEKTAMLSKDTERIEKELNAVRDEIKALDIYLEAAERRLSYESEVKKSSKLLTSRKEELASTNIDENSIYSMQERITKESSKLSDITSRVEGNKRYLANINTQIEEKAKQIANINLIRERIERRRKYISEMNKFRVALVDTEGLLRNRLITSINNLMQSVWSEIYPYADYNGIKLDAGKDDYRLEASTSIGDGGSSAWTDVDGTASGGERSMACLAMRIALAMVIVPNLRWLILDEPTHNIDENGIGKFIEMLGSSLPKVVEQVFVITHDNELKQISSARIYQLDRDKYRNGYTKVVEL